MSEVQKLFYLTNIVFLKAPAVRLMDAFYTMNNTGFCLDNQTKQGLLYFSFFQCEVIDSLQSCAFKIDSPGVITSLLNGLHSFGK